MLRFLSQWQYLPSQEAEVEEGLKCARQGLGQVRMQAEARQGYRLPPASLAIDQISQFCTGQWKCQHVHTQSHCDPFTAQQNFLLWSSKSAPSVGTAVYRKSALGRSLREPTEHTAPLSGVHNGPSQERPLISYLRKNI